MSPLRGADAFVLQVDTPSKQELEILIEQPLRNSHYQLSAVVAGDEKELQVP
jgi:hypothetical protein